MNCPKCGQETPENGFCLKCGESMQENCVLCGRYHPIGTVWCPVNHKHIEAWAKTPRNDEVAKSHPAHALGLSQGLCWFFGLLVVYIADLLIFHVKNQMKTDVKWVLMFLVYTTVIGLVVLIFNMGEGKFRKEVLEDQYQEVLAKIKETKSNPG